MKALLLSFSVGLVAALQAQAFPASSEEPQDAPEKWYLKAIASDDNVIPARNMGSVSVTPLTIKNLEDGSLKVKFTALIAGHCQEINVILEKTDEPGKYVAYGGDYVIRVVKSPVEDDYILFCEWSDEMHGPLFHMAKLVGRHPEINQEALRSFEIIARAQHLHTGNIFIPKQMATCSPESN
uniref:von Ebner gland protein 2-like n=1 Tax=Jaculus jaculus TaxID=51337 RepID=UPI001E1B0DBB|nr:von Ebner gland protein 2-like [Jaculus jaculus]